MIFPLSTFSLDSSDDPSSLKDFQVLITRMKLWPQLIRFQQEEEIVRIVCLESEFVEKERIAFLNGRSLDVVLNENFWSSDDLDLVVSRPEALRRFAKQSFGPGLEELFLSSKGNHDQVIYSVLRVTDPGIAQELWIRIAEGESTFSEMAAQFGEGPEAAKKGIMGPVPMGNIFPVELRQLLRTLKVGEVHPPTIIRDCRLLLRLEQLSPARFDSKMQQFLLDQQLNSFLQNRVQKILSGDAVDPLDFDPSL